MKSELEQLAEKAAQLHKDWLDLKKRTREVIRDNPLMKTDPDIDGWFIRKLMHYPGDLQPNHFKDYLAKIRDLNK